MEDRELTRAVVAFIGKGRSPFPRTDPDAVAAVASSENSAALLVRVREIVDEMMSMQIDWSTTTLSDGSHEAARLLAAEHPELGADAVEALRWMFTYNWR